MRVNRPLLPKVRQRGLTLVELMIALAISLILVLAATYVYLATRQSDRVIERSSEAQETGAYVLQLLGREIMNAGFYPASRPPMVVDATQTGMIDGYPPYQGTPRLGTDWMNTATGWPPTAFMSGIFGCDGAALNVETSTCGAAASGDGDTIVVNYFTNDSMDSSVGARRDCTGADVAPASDTQGDPSNKVRKKNTGGTPPLTPHTGLNTKLPPQQPVFVSNRYTLKAIKLAVDQTDVNSKSLVCSGNGKSPHGTADASAYQPIVAGVADLKFTYGVYSDDTTRAPAKFYTATEVSALSSENINGQALSGWQRVTAVRVCVITQTLGGGTRLADKAGESAKYLDCADSEQDQPVGTTMTRFVEVFGLRNALKQTF